MLHILEHTLSHTIEDSVKSLPFLFHLFINGIVRAHDRRQGAEQNQECRESWMLVGRTSWNYATVRVFCRGVSLYAGRVITVGTAACRIFCPRRMRSLPIFISESVALATIIKILAQKSALRSFQDFLQNWFM